MAGHEHSQVRPKTAQNLSKISAGSPLAIQGLFLEILRERFKKDNGLSILWDADITQTGVLIETSYNEETESRSQIPAIYVTRLESRPTREVLGDRAGVELKTHLEGFAALMTVAMYIECVSNDEGESAILGDTVQFTLLTAQDIIQKEFGLYHFEHPVLGQTVSYDRDTKKWATPVSFSIQFWIRWSHVPIVPLLQQIQTKVTNGSSNVFRDAVITSMRRASKSK